MAVTEIGCMGVKPNLNIMDPSTREGRIMTGAYEAVVSKPGGPQQVYWGLEIENPLSVWAFFDWDSVEEHEVFAKAFGGEAVKELPTILTHGEFTKHIAMKKTEPLVLQSPVTEVMLTYFPSDISPAGKDKAAAQLQQFVEKSLENCSDVIAVSYGWGVENDFPVRGGEPGQLGSLLTAFIGWPSIDAHRKFRETDAFKEGVDLIRDMEGIVELAMFHISCQSLGKETK